MYSMKKMVLKRKGSVAIILSTMVSAGVLFTIYFTQKMAGDFLSSRSQSMEEWEKHLVTQSVEKLAAYLVSNTLILCRKDGWQGKSADCKWNDSSGASSPSEFNLSNPSDSSDGFSLDGQIEVEGNNRNYKMTVSLVNWQNTAVERVIGEIPEYICRNKTNMSIIKDANCPDYDTLSSADRSNQACQRGGVDVPNSQCEYVSPVDGDYYIVLLKVAVPFIDPVSNLQQQHVSLSGIRRPLALIVFQSVLPGKRCSQSCDTGSTLGLFPDCRSDAVPAADGQYSGIASKIITIKNEGPGAVYKLSFMRTDIDISSGEVSLNVTPNIINSANKEVLLPGETLKIEDFYKCPHVVRTEVVYRVGSADGVSHTVRNSIVPFAQTIYNFYVDKNPVGSCYKDAGNILTATASDVDTVVPIDRNLLNTADCSGANTCSDGTNNGSCEYIDIEPRRLFTSPFSNIDSTLEQTVTTKVTVITTMPPARARAMRSSAATNPGFAGGDGADGGGN